ncbi:MAG TPA: response regulator transcription factor [Stellaceae bacterium]|nr:response regulator transcription factor [Stellaceae bacterium]HMD66311.1 response regulator transcription factor [Stellaceae bacterium]
MRLLLVEDNERFAALLKRGLSAAGFVVDVLATADDAAAALRTSRFEIVVLDLGLPDADGLEVLTEMRRRGDPTPVLILTARGGLKDRVTGLQSGADDYLVKPFALEELIARLQALLRRPGSLLGVALKLGNVTLDTVARQLFVGDQPIFFSPREIAVLEHLLRRSGRVVAKTFLEDNLYGLSQEVGSNAVEVYVHRLRRHLAEVGASVQIHTLRGVGYLIAAEK